MARPKHNIHKLSFNDSLRRANQRISAENKNLHIMQKASLYPWVWDRFLDARGAKIAAILRRYLNDNDAARAQKNLAHFGVNAPLAVVEKAEKQAAYFSENDDIMSAIADEFSAYFAALIGR